MGREVERAETVKGKECGKGRNLKWEGRWEGQKLGREGIVERGKLQIRRGVWERPETRKGRGVEWAGEGGSGQEMIRTKGWKGWGDGKTSGGEKEKVRWDLHG